MNKTDFYIFKRGCKRMAISMLTAAFFILSIWGFIVTATAPGYLAVLTFLASVIWLGMAVFFLYVQGIVHSKRTESKGEEK